MLAFRDGANGDARSAALSVNSSIGFDEEGAAVIVTARDRLAALAEGAQQAQAAPVAPASALGHGGGGNEEPVAPPSGRVNGDTKGGGAMSSAALFAFCSCDWR